ncbi:hypothetical protein STENM327S_08274 [Streptomyces tendae]
MADVISGARTAARSDVVRWLVFSLLCAGGSLGLPVRQSRWDRAYGGA